MQLGIMPDKLVIFDIDGTLGMTNGVDTGCFRGSV